MSERKKSKRENTRPKLRRINTTHLPAYTPLPSPGETQLQAPTVEQGPSASASGSGSATTAGVNAPQASTSQSRSSTLDSNTSAATDATDESDSAPPPEYEVYQLTPRSVYASYQL